ncbi:MAG TPA: DUF2203 domain-containing protein [Chloroflexota bacterium]|jgi:hypothetical protein|nr:DUF2203 domain-containing protein [Chloroflexota bacterium]
MEGQPQQHRYFTLEEANRLLPQIRQILEQLQSDAAELSAVQRTLQASGRSLGGPRGPRGNGHVRDGAAARFYEALERIDALLTEMRSRLHELQQIGCEVKDIRMGLVDFRAMREGRAVYLCWRLGEDEIRYWHELDTGFSGRQPLYDD